MNCLNISPEVKKVINRNYRRWMKTTCILCIVVALITGATAGLADGLCTSFIKDERVQEENVIYGAYDIGAISVEPMIDWEVTAGYMPLDIPLSEESQQFIVALCQAYEIDYTLVFAVIQQESNYDPSVISATNDYGLMQININNHKYLTEVLGITDFLEPLENIRAGCFVLRKLFEKYQDTNMVLMAYNMGESGASRLWKYGIYSTRYTDSVLAIQKEIMEMRGGDN